MPKRFRLFALVAGLIVFVLVMRTVLNPYGDKDWVEIPHGDHVHYVPKDRDPNVPINRFPNRPPGPNERLMPDGRIVPR